MLPRPSAFSFVGAASRRIFVGLALTAALSVPTSRAQDPRLQDEVVLSLPGMEDVAIRADIPFKEVDGRALGFDLYSPPAAEGLTRPPLVIFVNGVGDGDIALKDWSIYRWWPKLVAVSGMVAIVHNSRQQHVGEDFADLVDHVRTHADSLGVDANNVCIWASSANLNTGFPFAVNPENSFVKCAVFYYGMVDAARARADLPVFFARAGLDSPHNNTTVDAYVARALQLNAPVVVHNLPNGRHGFDVIDKNDASREVVRATLAFMKANLSREVQDGLKERSLQVRAIRLVKAQNWNEGLEPCQEWVAQEPENGQALESLASCQYGVRMYEEAAHHFERSGDLHFSPARNWYNAACCRALIGDKEQSLALLEKAIGTGRITDLAFVRNDGDFASIKDDPRFKRLTEPQATPEEKAEPKAEKRQASK